MRTRTKMFGLLKLIAIAGCTTDMVSPEMEQSACLVSASLPSLADAENGAQIFLVQGSVDTSTYNLEKLWRSGPPLDLNTQTISVVTKPGERVYLFAVSRDDRSLHVSPEEKTPTMLVLHDWTAVDPQQHRGIVYDGATEVNVVTNGSRYSPEWDYLGEMPPIRSWQALSSATVNVNVTLPTVSGNKFFATQSVQSRSFACMANDRMTFASARGVVFSAGGKVTSVRRIPTVLVETTMYESSTAAMRARSQINAQLVSR